MVADLSFSVRISITQVFDAIFNQDYMKVGRTLQPASDAREKILLPELLQGRAPDELKLLEWVKRLMRDFRSLPRYSRDVRSIARRMFVTNAFDSLLASLGVSVGGYASTADPKLLGLSIVGGGLAMGLFSGVIGVYLSERAERLRELREIERSMARSLEGTVYAEMARLIPVYVALWSGLGAVAFPILVALPYFASAAGLAGIRTAYYMSLSTGTALSALLGYYLAIVSGESKLVSTLRLLALAIGGVIAVYLMKLLVGGAP